MSFQSDKTFGRDFSFASGEYENCVFGNCDFSGRDLSRSMFTDCVFNDCNFSSATVEKTAFREVSFHGCKLLGMRFDRCDAFLFAASFTNCQLDLASFYRLKLRRQKFSGCSMRETDFTETDLTQAVFDDCELASAIFDNTILEKADLRTSYNFTIDPEQNHLRGARFSLQGASGLLAKYGIEIG